MAQSESNSHIRNQQTSTSNTSNNRRRSATTGAITHRPDTPNVQRRARSVSRASSTTSSTSRRSAKITRRRKLPKQTSLSSKNRPKHRTGLDIPTDEIISRKMYRRDDAKPTEEEQEFHLARAIEFPDVKAIQEQKFWEDIARHQAKEEAKKAAAAAAAAATVASGGSAGATTTPGTGNDSSSGGSPQTLISMPSSARKRTQKKGATERDIFKPAHGKRWNRFDPNAGASARNQVNSGVVDDSDDDLFESSLTLSELGVQMELDALRESDEFDEEDDDEA